MQRGGRGEGPRGGGGAGGGYAVPLAETLPVGPVIDLTELAALERAGAGQSPASAFEEDAVLVAPTAPALEALDQDWFSADQLNALHNVPVARPVADGGFEPLAGVVDAIPVVTGFDQGGAHVTTPSPADFTTDLLGGGIKSCDPLLSESVEALIQFLGTHNSPPHVKLEVTGFHLEEHVRIVETEDASSGKRVSKKEITHHRVVDWESKMDLTDLVFPYGSLVAAEGGRSLESVAREYLEDSNMLKTLVVEKRVVFDFDKLKRLVRGYYRRRCGWQRGLDLSLSFSNHRIRVYEDNSLSSYWESTPWFLLMCVTVVPAAAMLAYQWGHKNKTIKSQFRIQLSPEEVFTVLLQRNQLAVHW